MPVPLARFAPAAARGSTRLVALGVVVVVALAACSPATPSATASTVPATSGPSVPPSSSTAPSVAPSIAPSVAPSPSPSQAATLLLEVKTGGGFINPAASIGALPTVVVDTDGRIYLPGLAPDGSNPLIPVVAVRDTGAAGATAILAAAKAAGLVDGTGGGGVMADAGVTIFTLEVNGTEVVTKVAAGGPGGPGGPGASGRPGAAAVEFLTRLTDPATAWGGASAPATTYAPTEYRVWVAPDASLASGATNAPWPLTADPKSFGTPAAANLGVDGLRSGVVSGADAITLATALAKVPSGSGLTAKGAVYRVWVEPLLPVAVGG